MNLSRRIMKHPISSFLTCVQTLVLTLFLISSHEVLPQTNVLTWHDDNLRTGQNLSEAILTPANVKSSTFGLRFNFHVDGKVDAQPLYVSGVQFATQGTHNVIYAATEHDSVYAFDADTGKQYWKVSMLGPGETPSDNRGCGQVTPEIGITSTPAIDLKSGLHGAIFLVAMSKDASGKYYQRLHALDLTTGSEELTGPRVVEASYPGKGDNSRNGSVVFDPGQYKERPGLLLVNGVIYTSWGSHCDHRPYTGWIIAYRESNLQQTGVLNFAPNGNDAALWNSGAGPASDAQGNIYAALANGTFDPTLTSTGFPSLGDYGNSLVKVSTSNGKLSVADYWTMDNTIVESGSDTDFGSGGAMLLPNMADSRGELRQLAVAAGKDRNLYVVDRDDMGHYDRAENGTIYQELPGALPGGIWSSPAYFNGMVYYGSVNQKLFAFQVNSARLSSSPLSTSTTIFEYPGTTPSVSAYGRTNGIVWAIENSSLAVLHAYNATNLSIELYNSNQAASSRDHFGAGNKFMVPTIANGKVFVGTTNSVAAFGLLSSIRPPMADGIYTLTNHSSGFLLGDPGLSVSSGTRIIQWQRRSGAASEEWFFSSQGSGYYTIQNEWSGLLLTDTNGSKTPSIPLVQQLPTHDDSQLWSLIAVNGGFMIQNKASSLVIEDPKSSKVQGTVMILDSRNTGTNEVWTIQ